MMKAYVLKPTDHLARLAFTGGFDAEAIWNDPKNAALRAKRGGDSKKLCTGDVLFIPDRPKQRLPFQSGTANRYEAHVPRVRVEVQFLEGDAPLAARPCQVIDDQHERTMATTDAEGRLTLDVPIVAKKMTVFFELGQAFTFTLTA